MKTNQTISYWIIFIVGILIMFMLIFGQAMSLISYEFSVSLGLQESQQVVGDMGVIVNKSFALSDTIIYLPILICGLIGFWREKSWSIPVMAGALAITAYWPIICIRFLFLCEGTPNFHFTSYTSYTLFLSSIVVYGLWGFCYLCTHPHLFQKQ